MVEEMMLLANVTVAEHVLSYFAGCALLRRHQVPPPRQFEPLLKAASAAHFSVDISSSKVSPDRKHTLRCPWAFLGRTLNKESTETLLRGIRGPCRANLSPCSKLPLPHTSQLTLAPQRSAWTETILSDVLRHLSAIS